MARKTISATMLCAKPQAAEPARKIVAPLKNMVLRP
jgi:hypothetical protein